MEATLCCNKKFVYFTGNSHLACKVVAKSTRIGLWLYQDAVLLKNEFLILVATNVQDTPTTNNAIIDQWIDIVKNGPYLHS